MFSGDFAPKETTVSYTDGCLSYPSKFPTQCVSNIVGLLRDPNVHDKVPSLAPNVFTLMGFALGKMLPVGTPTPPLAAAPGVATVRRQYSEMAIHCIEQGLPLPPDDQAYVSVGNDAANPAPPDPSTPIGSPNLKEGQARIAAAAVQARKIATPYLPETREDYDLLLALRDAVYAPQPHAAAETWLSQILAWLKLILDHINLGAPPAPSKPADKIKDEEPKAKRSRRR